MTEIDLASSVIKSTPVKEGFNLIYNKALSRVIIEVDVKAFIKECFGDRYVSDILEKEITTKVNQVYKTKIGVALKKLKRQWMSNGAVYYKQEELIKRLEHKQNIYCKDLRQKFWKVAEKIFQRQQFINKCTVELRRIVPEVIKIEVYTVGDIMIEDISALVFRMKVRNSSGEVARLYELMREGDDRYRVMSVRFIDVPNYIGGEDIHYQEKYTKKVSSESLRELDTKPS